MVYLIELTRTEHVAAGPSFLGAAATTSVGVSGTPVEDVGFFATPFVC